MEVGTISHGTHRDQDLIPIFLETLEKEDPGKGLALREQYSNVLPRLKEDPQDEILFEHISWLMDDLFDALNEIAPIGYYFGHLEGDGSDFGFFPAHRPSAA